MFQVNAILNSSVLDDVLQGLHDENIEGATVSKVFGKGCLEHTESGLTEKVMLVILVADTHHKEIAMEAIRANAQDIGPGSGKMWITSVLEVERIRTGEKDLDALTYTPHANTTRKPLDNDFFSAIDTPAS